MPNGTVVGIYIAQRAGDPMLEMSRVEAVLNTGILGDCYQSGAGSWNRGEVGKRQITLINARFFSGSGFTFADSRRNIITEGVELMWLIGREFRVGQAILKGVKYCDPCNRPSKLCGSDRSFMHEFFDCAGLVAEVMQSGYILKNNKIIVPDRGY